MSGRPRWADFADGRLAVLETGPERVQKPGKMPRPEDPRRDHANAR